MNFAPAWTKEEDETLLRMFPDHEYAEIALATGRPVGGVKKRAVVLGLYKNDSALIRGLTAEQLEMLKQAREDKLPIDSITRLLGCSRYAVARAINLLNLQRRVTTPKAQKRAEPKLGPLELAEGHFAVDQRSYEIWAAVLRGEWKEPACMSKCE